MVEKMTSSDVSAPQVVEVAHAGDVSAARQASRIAAHALGFDAMESEEVAIAVSELASNLLKHAGRGTLTFIPLREGDRVGIQIESLDHGPGISNIGQAITDGFSTSGSLGYGLGAVNRLMDDLNIAPRSQGKKGTRIVCLRWRPAINPAVKRCPLELGVATRPHPAMEKNGDTFVLRRWGESILAGVIDGVGHGELAFQAAREAQLFVEAHFDRPLDALFRGVGRACRGTQGVVMALARFDWGNGRLAFASVGNVESRVFACPQKLNFIVRRGLIGLNAPDPVVTEHPWEPGQIMVLHSDGVRSHWQWEDFPALREASASRAAQRLLDRLARDDDDATVMVVKAAPPPQRTRSDS
jgi:anti-sigma regulatory factor (Ser/Thr protein kinase)/serine/threonine protein phosphatase PrpC